MQRVTRAAPSTGTRGEGRGDKLFSRRTAAKSLPRIEAKTENVKDKTAKHDARANWRKNMVELGLNQYPRMR